MDAVEKANYARQKRWYDVDFSRTAEPHTKGSRLYRAKDQKVGEGTYAVVYKGKASQVFLITSNLKRHC